MHVETLSLHTRVFAGAISVYPGRTKRYGEIICHPDFSDSRLLVYSRSHVRSAHAESQSSGCGVSAPTSPSSPRSISGFHWSRQNSVYRCSTTVSSSEDHDISLCDLFHLALPHCGHVQTCWSKSLLWLPNRHSEPFHKAPDAVSARQPLVQSTKGTAREPNGLESLEIASRPIALKLYFESGKTSILRFDSREVRDQCLNVLQYVVQANKLRNGYPDFEHVWCVIPKIYAKDPFATSLLTKFSRGRHYFCLTDSEALLCRKDLRVPVLMVPYSFVRQCTSRRDGRFILCIGRGAPTGACKLVLRLCSGPEAESLHGMFARLMKQAQNRLRSSCLMRPHEYFFRNSEPLPLPNAALLYDQLDFPWIDDTDSGESVVGTHAGVLKTSKTMTVSHQKNSSVCSAAETAIKSWSCDLSDDPEYVNITKTDRQQGFPALNKRPSSLTTKNLVGSVVNTGNLPPAQYSSIRSIKRKTDGHHLRYVEMTSGVSGKELPCIRSATDSGITSLSSNRDSILTDFSSHFRVNSYRPRTHSSPWTSTMYTKRRPSSHRENPDLFAAITFAPHPLVLNETASDFSATRPFSITLVKPAHISLIHSSPASRATSPVLKRGSRTCNWDDVIRPRTTSDLAATKRPLFLNNLIRLANESFHNGFSSSPPIPSMLLRSVVHPQQNMNAFCAPTHPYSERPKSHSASSNRNNKQSAADSPEGDIPLRPRANTVASDRSMGRRIAVALVNLGARIRPRTKSASSGSMDRVSCNPPTNPVSPHVVQLPSQFRCYANPFECDERMNKEVSRAMSIYSVSALNLSDHYLVYEYF
ncbi:hypothetical protein CSKR_109480 [Clonorchis sinensis]|uniref:IRS-type PTB domain-containing protein n=1 Tax=Clonorchis sinensis TaxID=79923 RepID=A0A8T1MF01_CLOSI|nr:hypothetical protein CSKR_109480 [Clonorchis sinensis]